MQNCFDVVVVPDFSGSKPFTFELRTLFFLATWMENAGNARDFPLHLVCIGEPPASVRWLANKCRARITVHDGINTRDCIYLNKLRGFEVQRETEYMLLLDADVMVFGDPSRLSDLGNCIAVAIDHLPAVSEQYWKRIYATIGKELPERTTNLRWDLNLPKLKKLSYPLQQAEQESMVPYYNGGIIYSPWGNTFRQAWTENIQRLLRIFEGVEHSDEGDMAAVTTCDQAGLSMTIEQFRDNGICIKRLPYALHSNWMHLYRRTVPVKETVFFHSFRIFDGVDNEQINRNHFKYEYGVLSRQLRREWPLNDNKSIKALFKYLVPALRDVRQFNSMLRKCYELHVREALAQNPNG